MGLLNNYADPEKIYENSRDLREYAKMESKEKAIRIAEELIDENDIKTDNAKITLDSNFSINDSINIEDFNVEIPDECIEYDGSYRRNKLEQRCYDNVSMTGAFTYLSLFVVVLVPVLLYTWFSISTISMFTEVNYFGEYLNVALGLVTVLTTGILQVMMWYPRNLNLFEVDISYNDYSFLMLIGVLNGLLLPIAWYLDMTVVAVVSFFLIPIFAMWTDETMINDELKFYMGLGDKKETLYGEEPTHDHLPEDLYQFNVKRRAFLWFSVTVSITSGLIWSELPSDWLYDVVFGVLILMPILVMIQYLRHRSNIEELV